MKGTLCADAVSKPKARTRGSLKHLPGRPLSQKAGITQHPSLFFSYLFNEVLKFL